MNERNYTRKAKRADNGDWVEGFYFCMVHDDGRHIHHFIMPLGVDLSLGTPIERIQVEIDPATICEPTGITTDNGDMIWENDIIRYDSIDATGKVVYLADRGWFAVKDVKRGIQYYDERLWKLMDVIGNAFDNSELLEV